MQLLNKDQNRSSSSSADERRQAKAADVDEEEEDEHLPASERGLSLGFSFATPRSSSSGNGASGGGLGHVAKSLGNGASGNGANGLASGNGGSGNEISTPPSTRKATRKASTNVAQPPQGTDKPQGTGALGKPRRDLVQTAESLLIEFEQSADSADQYFGNAWKNHTRYCRRLLDDLVARCKEEKDVAINTKLMQCQKQVTVLMALCNCVLKRLFKTKQTQNKAKQNNAKQQQKQATT